PQQAISASYISPPPASGPISLSTGPILSVEGTTTFSKKIKKHFHEGVHRVLVPSASNPDITNLLFRGARIYG
ncbi:hypothetical protein, partial [Qipengyuania huizhouensis]|uniref:hypothetical protein n=1 Tax=Qipengyuania huizhouensis TaxID=2867245 RepID=UPI001C8721CC